MSDISFDVPGVSGGRYQDANGKWMDANGNSVEPDDIKSRLIAVKAQLEAQLAAITEAQAADEDVAAAEVNNHELPKTYKELLDLAKSKGFESNSQGRVPAATLIEYIEAHK